MGKMSDVERGAKVEVNGADAVEMRVLMMRMKSNFERASG